MKRSEVLTEIVNFARGNLKEASLAYLKQERKLSDRIIEEFQLGFFPLRASLPIEPKWLRYHRLICKDLKNEIRCPFEGRILIPIHDIYGNIISIQARVFETDPLLENYNNRKYYHSSFEKSKTLFNLNRSIPYIRRSDKVIVTEGQFDTIAAWKFNFKNCVCCTGTVFNYSQISLLSRYASSILVIFDNDVAGRESMNKLKRMKPMGVKIRFLLLPSINGKIDLDDFLHKEGRKALVNLVKKAKD